MDNSSSRSTSRDTLGSLDSNSSNNGAEQETPGTEVGKQMSQAGSHIENERTTRSAASKHSNTAYPSIHPGSASERFTPETRATLSHPVPNITRYPNTTSAAVYFPYFASTWEWAARSQAFHARTSTDRSILISSVGPQAHAHQRTWMVPTQYGWIHEREYDLNIHGHMHSAAVADAATTAARLQAEAEQRIRPGETVGEYLARVDQDGDSSAARLQAFEDEQYAALMQALDDEAAENEQDVDSSAGSGQESDEDDESKLGRVQQTDRDPTQKKAKNKSKNKNRKAKLKEERAKKKTAKHPESGANTPSDCVTAHETLSGPGQDHNSNDSDRQGSSSYSSKNANNECVKDLDTLIRYFEDLDELMRAIAHAFKEEKIREDREELKAKKKIRRAKKAERNRKKAQDKEDKKQELKALRQAAEEKKAKKQAEKRAGGAPGGEDDPSDDDDDDDWEDEDESVKRHETFDPKQPKRGDLDKINKDEEKETKFCAELARVVKENREVGLKNRGLTKEIEWLGDENERLEKEIEWLRKALAQCDKHAAKAADNRTDLNPAAPQFPYPSETLTDSEYIDRFHRLWDNEGSRLKQ